MICSKNKELQSKVDEYAPLMKSNASQLSMVLNGVIDANVNGGIANYQSVCVDLRFFGSCQIFLHPHDFVLAPVL